MAELLTFTDLPGGWAIEGELDHTNLVLLRAWSERVAAVQEPRLLALAGLEIADAEALGAATEAIRLLLQRSSALTISDAPHLLAHTLYRLGMLEPGSRLELVEPRQEEPYG